MKKKGRALTAVLLGLTMVMSLAGCGQKKESTADTAAAGSEAAKTEESTGEKSTSAEMETITLKLGFNGDFLTMPEAVLGAAENLNKKYEQEGKNIRIEFETDYQTIDNSEYHNISNQFPNPCHGKCRPCSIPFRPLDCNQLRPVIQGLFNPLIIKRPILKQIHLPVSNPILLKGPNRIPDPNDFLQCIIRLPHR